MSTRKNTRLPSRSRSSRVSMRRGILRLWRLGRRSHYMPCAVAGFRFSTWLLVRELVIGDSSYSSENSPITAFRIHTGDWKSFFARDVKRIIGARLRNRLCRNPRTAELVD